MAVFPTLRPQPHLAPFQLALEVPFPWNVLPRPSGAGPPRGPNAVPPPVLSALCHSQGLTEEDRKKGGAGKEAGRVILWYHWQVLYQRVTGSDSRLRTTTVALA